MSTVSRTRDRHPRLAGTDDNQVPAANAGPAVGNGVGGGGGVAQAAGANAGGHVWVERGLGGRPLLVVVVGGLVRTFDPQEVSAHGHAGCRKFSVRRRSGEAVCIKL